MLRSFSDGRPMTFRIMTVAAIVVVGLTAALAIGPGDASVEPAPADALPAKPPPTPVKPPATQPMCSDVKAVVTTFNDDLAIPPLGWADNVVFDGEGGMWVS